MKPFKPHPYSKLFPDCNEEQFEMLCKDLKENGQRQKALIFQGLILDGNQRQRACVKNKMELQWKCFKGSKEAALNLVVSLNLHRRHLNDSQRACIGAEIIKMNKRTNNWIAIKRGVQGRSHLKLVKIMNVTQRKLRDALYVKKYAPEKFEECKTNGDSVGAAAKSIYRDLNQSDTTKIPTCFSSDFEISQYAKTMCSEDGLNMMVDIVEGKFFARFGNGHFPSRSGFGEDSIKRAVVCGIRDYIENKNKLALAL